MDNGIVLLHAFNNASVVSSKSSLFVFFFFVVHVLYFCLLLTWISNPLSVYWSSRFTDASGVSACCDPPGLYHYHHGRPLPSTPAHPEPGQGPGAGDSRGAAEDQEHCGRTPGCLQEWLCRRLHEGPSHDPAHTR